jgi:hypothetical protein
MALDENGNEIVPHQATDILDAESILSESPLEVQTGENFSFDIDAAPEALKDVEIKQAENTVSTDAASSDPLRAGEAKTDGVVKKYLSGKLAVQMLDVGLSRVATAIPPFKATSIAQWKLDKQEIEDLTPLAQAVIDEMDMNISPVTAFLFVFIAMYLFKGLTLWDYGKENNDNKAKEPSKESTTNSIASESEKESKKGSDSPTIQKYNEDGTPIRKRGRQKGFKVKKKEVLPDFDKDGVPYAEVVN